MDQKKEFVLKAFDPNVNFTELCTHYGISTKTGYKWVERFRHGGLPALCNKSKRPKSSPNKADEDTICEIIYTKLLKPRWGSRKIHRIFCSTHENEQHVSRSTVDRILNKVGLTDKKKRRKKCTPERLQLRITPQEPNDVWTVDFKGWWYCYPSLKTTPGRHSKRPPSRD